MTEREKMLAGLPFATNDPELKELRNRCYHLLDKLNATSNADKPARTAILEQLLGTCGQGVNVKSLFQCDYGTNIHLADGVFVNVNCVFSDAGPIHVGEGTLIGPQVGIYSVTHPVDAAARAAGNEWGEAVNIGKNCWIGGHATINPGVTLGDNVVVGSGAVVTKSFPDNVVIAGVPARVIREL